MLRGFVIAALGGLVSVSLSGCATDYAGFVADAALEPPAVELARAASGEALEL